MAEDSFLRKDFDHSVSSFVGIPSAIVGIGLLLVAYFTGGKAGNKLVAPVTPTPASEVAPAAAKGVPSLEMSLMFIQSMKVSSEINPHIREFKELIEVYVDNTKNPDPSIVYKAVNWYSENKENPQVITLFKEKFPGIVSVKKLSGGISGTSSDRPPQENPEVPAGAVGPDGSNLATGRPNLDGESRVANPYLLLPTKPPEEVGAVGTKTTLKKQ